MKKFSALIAAIAITIGLIPSVYADNSEYIGFYTATDADGVSFAELTINNCDEDSFSINLKRIKKGVEKITYVFDEGNINPADGIGTTKFTATLTASGATLPGTATLSFINRDYVKITCISYQNELFYEGTMKRNNTVIVPTPAATEAPTQAPVATEAPTQAPVVTETPTQTPVVTETPTQTPQAPDEVYININGKNLEFHDNAKPIIVNNYTYIPLRSVLSNLGINVYWDEYNKTGILKEQLITCTKNSTILQFARTLNNSGENTWTLKKWVNASTDTPGSNIDIIYLQPVLIGNKSYIPLRIVSESFGAAVAWDAITRTVIINSDTSNEFLYNSDIIGAMEDFTQPIAQSYLTSDFTSVLPYPTPYFAPQGKFYSFDAHDQWNEISLKIFYGGFIDVLPKPNTNVLNVENIPQNAEETVQNTESIIQYTDVVINTEATEPSADVVIETEISQTVATDENTSAETVVVETSEDIASTTVESVIETEEITSETSISENPEQ